METYHGFAVEELKKAFELIQNKEHWKNKIDSVCNSEEIKVMGVAVIFYTATTPTFDFLCSLNEDRGRFKKGDYLFQIRADGYRRGPAGDH